MSAVLPLRQSWVSETGDDLISQALYIIHCLPPFLVLWWSGLGTLRREAKQSQPKTDLPAGLQDLELPNA